ncbi:helix-turn-helix transcriptional regulator [Rhizobium sp. RCAM05350]|nr:helix-turn-helix transcriptional regulator [Rhizobium sp. RCAM05350]
MNFDPTKFQQSPNGPLAQETIKRLVAIKERRGMSYAALGEKLGMSGTFLHHLINKSANVGTQHVERIATALGNLENPDGAPEPGSSDVGMLQHTFHLRPDLQVKIELPTDLSEREAERLAPSSSPSPLPDKRIYR